MALKAKAAPGHRPPWLRWLRRAAGSLKLRMTLAGIAALTLGIGLTAFLLVSRAERDTLEAERQHELGESVRTAALLSRRVVDLQRALLSVVPQLDAATLGDEPALMQFAQSKPLLRSLFTFLFVADAQGDVSLYADAQGARPRNANGSVNVSDRDYFVRTVAEGRGQISRLLRDKRTGGPLIMFTQPIRAADGDRGTLGVLGGALRLNSRDLLEGLVELQEDDGASAMVVVTDAEGLVLAHPDRHRVMKPLTEEPRLSLAFADWKASGAPVEPLGLSMMQPGELVSVAGVPGPDWVIWRTRSEAALLAPLRDARRDALDAAAALIALLSVGLLGLLWWLLMPLTLLQHRAQHLFDSRMAPQDGWPVAGGEIGSLSRVLRRIGIERVQMEARTAEVLGQLRSVMSAAPEGIAIVRAGSFELVGTEFWKLLGFEREEDLLARPAQRIFASDADHAAFVDGERDAFATHRTHAGEWQLLRGDGTRFWARLHSKPVDADDLSRGAVWILNDIDEQHATRARLEWSATHDPLTGLANRTAFTRRAERLVAGLPDSLPAAMVFIDLDHFKPVNDTAGHGMGDLMLLTVATAMASRVRADDLVVRLGGDEFALLLEGCSHDDALDIAHDVHAGIAQIALPWDQGLLRIGASLGVASLTARTGSVAEWLAAADAACYAAKDAGRGAVHSAAEPGPEPDDGTAAA